MALVGSGWRKWLAVGSGVGIEIGADELRLVVVRVRPTGVRVTAAATVGRFRERTAGDWGAECAGFLRRAAAGHLAAVVLLPRREVTVRQLTMPGVADKDLDAAIGFQIDSLHPYPEAETAAGWARLPKSSTVLVGVSRTGVIERYAALFAEAGLRLAGFTFSAAAIYSAIRLLAEPPAGRFLAVHAGDEILEAYGESPARPVYSAILEENGRSLALAAGELRLEPETAPGDIAALLPAPSAPPESFQPARHALAYAAALSSACPHLALATNLLPETKRSTSSRAALAPTAALALLLLAAGVVLASYDRIEDRRYLAALESESQPLEPFAARVQRADRDAAKLGARLALLADFRRRSQADLDAVQELTRLLAPPAWLQGIHLARAGVAMSGEAEQSAALLKLIDGSPLFRNSEFTQSIGRSAAGETFAIRTAREGVRP